MTSESMMDRARTESRNDLRKESQEIGWQAAQEFLLADDAERVRAGMLLLISAAVEQALKSDVGDASEEHVKKVAESFRRVIGEEIGVKKLKLIDKKGRLAASDYRLFYQDVYQTVSHLLNSN